MAGMIKYLQSFRFKGLTVILGVFLAISVVLCANVSGQIASVIAGGMVINLVTKFL